MRRVTTSDHRQVLSVVVRRARLLAFVPLLALTFGHATTLGGLDSADVAAFSMPADVTIPSTTTTTTTLPPVECPAPPWWYRDRTARDASIAVAAAELLDTPPVPASAAPPDVAGLEPEPVPVGEPSPETIERLLAAGPASITLDELVALLGGPVRGSAPSVAAPETPRAVDVAAAPSLDGSRTSAVSATSTMSARSDWSDWCRGWSCTDLRIERPIVLWLWWWWHACR